MRHRGIEPNNSVTELCLPDVMMYPVTNGFLNDDDGGPGLVYSLTLA